MKALRFILKSFVIVAVVIFLLLVATKLLDFQMSDKAVSKAFAKTDFRPKDHYLNFEEGELHYITAGDPARTPLLMIHGSPGAWTDFVDLITETDILGQYYVIALDRPGYGKTTLPGGYSLSDQARFAEALLQKYLDDQRGIILGHSYGGALTVEVAKRDPRLLEGIVVIAGTVADPYQDPRWYNHIVRKTPVKHLIGERLRTSNREMWQLEDDLRTMEEGLGDFHQKAALIQGGGDWLVDHRSAEYLKTLLPHARTKIFAEESMNHFIIWTDKEVVLKALQWTDATRENRQTSFSGPALFLLQ